MHLLALLLLQPERSWTLQELAQRLHAPASSVHRELSRAERAGLVSRDATARPHRFTAAIDDPLYEPLSELLRRSVGVEGRLRAALEDAGVIAAALYGSWVSGQRRPDSDIDVLVIGDVDLRELRRRTRPIAKEAGRKVDLTVLSATEFRRLAGEQSSFIRGVMEAPMTGLVGDLSSITSR